jgi:DNA primase
MAGRIPDNILDDILSRINIVEIVSSYIPLKRAGRNFKANCPFHHEKTPSFMVSPDRQIYHCFGCGAGGNAFGFLMQYERMEFPEAVETLAKKAGVEIPQLNNEDQKSAGLLTQLYKVNEFAVGFFSQNLTSIVKDYLAKRGITEDSVKLFKIGYAPDRWDGLINFLRTKSINLSIIDKAGLILNKESGGYYDRFRNRLIFPIFDIKDRPLGFGARVLDNSLPKYINSPETPVYTKGRNLYGLNFSKEAIRDSDEAVIVEGYLDFIIPFQAGVRNIVASLGTALTFDQARLLKRYTTNVVMVYDGDAAGELANLRSLDIFVEEGISVKVAPLPPGHDPDSLVRKFGAQRLKDLIISAQDLFDYKFNVLKNKFPLATSEAKAKIAQELLSTITKIKDAILKADYVKKLAERLDIDEQHIWLELKKCERGNTAFKDSLGQGSHRDSVSPTEKLLVKLMLEEDEFIRHIRQHLEPADFQDECVSRIVSIMYDLIEQGKKVEVSSLMNHLEKDELSRLVCEAHFSPELSFEDKERVVTDCIKRLKVQKLHSRKQKLHKQIKDAQDSGDEDMLRRLMVEFQELIRK